MSARNPITLLTLLVASVAAGACSGGGSGQGYLPPSSGKQEPGGSTYEPAGSGQEPAGGAQDPEGPNGYEQPGGSSSGSSSSSSSSSGGSSSGGNVCLACITYNCQISSVNGTASSALILTPLQGGGGCFSADADETLLCNGSVMFGDAQVRTWTSDGAGGFTASGSGLNVTCTPGSTAVSGGGTPGNGNGNNGNGNGNGGSNNDAG